MLLPCGHLYCSSPRNCLHDLRRGKKAILCVMCHSSFAVRPENFSCNPLLRILVRKLAHQKALITEACPRHLEFVKEFRCRDCDEVLCKLCWRGHETHSVELIQLTKQLEFSARMKQFDPHQRKLQSQQRICENSRQMKFLEVVLNRVRRYEEALETERELVENLKWELPGLRSRIETEELAKHEEKARKFLEKAGRTMLAKKHKTLCFSQDVCSGRACDSVEETNECLLVHDSYCDSMKRSPPHQLAEVLLFLLTPPKNQETNSAELDKWSSKFRD